MNKVALWSYSEVALDLGVRRSTVADLATHWGLTPKPMSNGKAKGLNASDIKVIRRALGMNRPQPAIA